MSEIARRDSGSVAESDDLIPIKVGIISKGLFTLALQVARAKGSLEKPGISLQIVEIKGKTPIELLVANEIQIASIPPEGIIKRIESGNENIKIIAGSNGKLMLDIIARSPFKTFSDLKGAVFGTIASDGGTLYQFEVIARQNGLEPGDYKVERVGGAPARWKALQEGTIDVALQPPPLIYMAEDAGFSNLGHTYDYIPEYQYNIFAANLDWAKENEGLMVAFLAGLMDTVRFAFNPENKEEVVEIIVNELGLEKSYAERGWQEFHDRRPMPQDLSVNIPGMKKVLEIMIQSGQLPKGTQVSPERYVFDEFRNRAVEPQSVSD